MCRCLDRAGVLPKSDLDKEIQDCTPAATPAPASTASVQSSSSAATAAPPGGLGTSEATRSLSGAEGQHSEASWPTLSVEGESLGLHSAVASTTSNASPASPSGQGNTSSPTQDGEASQDLYDIALPLLDRVSSMADQQRALRNVQRYLKDHPESPDVWRGPGSPLYASVKASRVDLARLLLRARASANEKDAKGVSALHLATFDGNTEICRALLVARADVDACDRHGQTSLFFAPTREVCKLLVEKRADITVLNRKGQSALHLAGRAGLQEVLSWLCTRVSRQVLDLKDIHGATARYYAAQTGGCPPLPEEKSASKRGNTLSSSSSSLAGSQTSHMANDHYNYADSPQDLTQSIHGMEFGQLPSVSEIIEEGRASQECSPNIDAASGDTTTAESGRRPSLPSVSTIVEAATTPNTAFETAGRAAHEDPHGAAKPKAASGPSTGYPVKNWSQKSAQVVVPAAPRRTSLPKAPSSRPAERSTTPAKMATPRASDSPASNTSSRESPMKKPPSAIPTPSGARKPAVVATTTSYSAMHSARTAQQVNGDVRTSQPMRAPPAAAPAKADMSASAVVATFAPTAAPAPAHTEPHLVDHNSNTLGSSSSIAPASTSRAVEMPVSDLTSDSANTAARAEDVTHFSMNPAPKEFSMCTSPNEDAPEDAREDKTQRYSIEAMYEDIIGEAPSADISVEPELAPLEVETSFAAESDDSGHSADEIPLSPPEDEVESTSHPVPANASTADSQARMSADEAAALAEAGVFDGDLEEEVGFNLQEENPPPPDCGSLLASPATPAVNDEQEDLAALGVIGDDQEDLAALGILGEDDMSTLHSPRPQDSNDLAEAGVFEAGDVGDMAALAEAGVLEYGGDDADGLAEAGVYEGDDHDLEEAGIFLGSFEVGNKRLSAVQEGNENLDEDDYDNEDMYEEGEEEEEEEIEEEEEEEEFGEGDAIDSDDLEEAW